MEALAVYLSSSWREAMHGLLNLNDRNTTEEVEAYERQLHHDSGLVYSVSASKWVKCDYAVNETIH